MFHPGKYLARWGSVKLGEVVYKKSGKVSWLTLTLPCRKPLRATLCHWLRGSFNETFLHYSGVQDSETIYLTQPDKEVFSSHPYRMLLTRAGTKILQRTLFGIQCSRLVALPNDLSRSIKSLVCVGIIPTLGLATRIMHCLTSSILVYLRSRWPICSFH